MTRGISRRQFLKALALAHAGVGLGGLRGLQARPQPVRLDFFYPVGVAGPLARIIEQYVREFNEQHPNILVTPIFGGTYAENQTKVVAAVKAGDPPDTAILLSVDLFTMLGLEAIEPFDSLLEGDPEGQAMLADFFPAFMANSTFDGKVWSIPFQRSTPIMYYNKEAFREVGLDPERPPETWDELLAFGKKLAKAGRRGVQIPEETWGIWMLEGLTIQAGGMLWDPAGRGCVVKLNTEETATAIRFLMRLKEEGVSPPDLTRWRTTPNDFATGAVAIAYHSTGSLGFIRRNARFAFGTAFQAKKVRFGVPTGGANFYLFKGQAPAKREATWTFIKWMTTPEMAARWSIDSGYVATRRSAWELPRMRDYVAEVPQAVTARDQLEYAKPELSTYNRPEVHVAVERAMADAILKRKPVPQALADGQQRIEEILAPFCA
ncbi:MAG: ABC transporter substrate-binding protein [Candidatus Tectimicrobiota bacterium]|nr:MAG: ABC transporter substrate-binding protein [Candidatus Tectomicrobia bacterium]